MQMIPLVVLPSLKEYAFAKMCKTSGRDKAAERFYQIDKRTAGSVRRIEALIQTPGIQAALAGVKPASVDAYELKDLRRDREAEKRYRQKQAEDKKALRVPAFMQSLAVQAAINAALCAQR